MLVAPDGGQWRNDINKWVDNETVLAQHMTIVRTMTKKRLDYDKASVRGVLRHLLVLQERERGGPSYFTLTRSTARPM
jgi:hypothetical protein